MTDHLGSVRDVVDNNGVVRQHLVFDSFGRRVREVDYNTSGQVIASNDPAAVDELFGYTRSSLTVAVDQHSCSHMFASDSCNHRRVLFNINRCGYKHAGTLWDVETLLNDRSLRSAVTRSARYEPTKQHLASAAINQAIIHARLALRYPFLKPNLTITVLDTGAIRLLRLSCP